MGQQQQFTAARQKREWSTPAIERLSVADAIGRVMGSGASNARKLELIERIRAANGH